MSKAVVLNVLIISVHLSVIANCELTQIYGNDLDGFIKSNSHAVVLFKSADECPSCLESQKLLGDLPQPELLQHVIQKRVMVDKKLAARYGATDFPAIVYFREGYPALYDKTFASDDDVPELLDWLEKSDSVATKELNEGSFEHLTQASTGSTTGDWLVLFYYPSCGDCLRVLPVMESVALRIRHRMNVAKVDVEASPMLKERFKIQQCPTTILFRQGKMYLYEPGVYNPKSLLSFVDGWYRNVKASSVPTEPTAFDRLTESIAMNIKEQLNDPNRRLSVIAALVLVPIVMIAVIYLTCRKPAETNRSKFD